MRELIKLSNTKLFLFHFSALKQGFTEFSQATYFTYLQIVMQFIIIDSLSLDLPVSAITRLERKHLSDIQTNEIVVNKPHE